MLSTAATPSLTIPTGNASGLGLDVTLNSPIVGDDRITATGDTRITTSGDTRVTT